MSLGVHTDEYPMVVLRTTLYIWHCQSNQQVRCRFRELRFRNLLSQRKHMYMAKKKIVKGNQTTNIYLKNDQKFYYYYFWIFGKNKVKCQGNLDVDFKKNSIPFHPIWDFGWPKTATTKWHVKQKSSDASLGVHILKFWFLVVLSGTCEV